MKSSEAVHRDPVWRHRSNFVIGAALEPSVTGVDSEQLWARRVGERPFELCCIPFLTYGLALAGVVETDANYNVVSVDRVDRSIGFSWAIMKAIRRT